MTGFQLVTPAQTVIRFQLYLAEAPATCAAFLALLPFSRRFVHARVSGQEIWTPEAPPLHIPQEQASVFTEPGEIVYGPAVPARVRTANCIGIYYGEGKGLDAANIFARVLPADLPALQELGGQIWQGGALELRFELGG
jgi:hypothetical protein